MKWRHAILGLGFYICLIVVGSLHGAYWIDGVKQLAYYTKAEADVLYALYELALTDEASLYATLSDVTEFTETGDAAGGDLGGTYPNPSVDDDSHAHVYSNIDSFTEANLYTLLSDVTQFYEAGDKVGDADTLDTHDTAYFQVALTDEASLYAVLSDVTQFYESGDKVGDADTLDTHDTAYFQVALTDEASLYSALSDVTKFVEDTDTGLTLGVANSGTLDGYEGADLVNIVTHRWDNVYAESIPLTHTANIPGTLYSSMNTPWSVPLSLTFLAFDDTTVEYAGPQTWQTWPTWNSNVTFRGSHYAAATGTAQYIVYYLADGGSVESTTSSGLIISSTANTTLNDFTWTATLSNITAGEAVHYWITRDVSDAVTGDVYLRNMTIGWEQQ